MSPSLQRSCAASLTVLALLPLGAHAQTAPPKDPMQRVQAESMEGTPTRGALLDARWELEPASKQGVFVFRGYKPVYLLPAFWSSRPNATPRSPNPLNTVLQPTTIEPLEAKFQLSFKTKAIEDLFGDNGDLWLGYTQSSRWQVYSAATSRPFRETNYEPEGMLVLRNAVGLGAWTWRLSGIGLNHQSNGRENPMSRSWNRVVGLAAFERAGWTLTVRPWWRIPEQSSRNDDNPDIADFVGRGDATLVRVRGGHQVSLTARHSLRGGERSHGALEFDWGFPIFLGARGHLQVFDGYGESLVDYNHRATYLGIGMSLLEWY